jgi:hypothetical protein
MEHVQELPRQWLEVSDQLYAPVDITPPNVLKYAWCRVLGQSQNLSGARATIRLTSRPHLSRIANLTMCVYQTH